MTPADYLSVAGIFATLLSPLMPAIAAWLLGLIRPIPAQIRLLFAWIRRLFDGIRDAFRQRFPKKKGPHSNRPDEESQASPDAGPSEKGKALQVSVEGGLSAVDKCLERTTEVLTQLQQLTNVIEQMLKDVKDIRSAPTQSQAS